MSYRYTDAGRSKSKHKSESNDCTVQTIKHAFDIRYWQAHYFCKWQGREDNEGFKITTVLDNMAMLGVTMNNRFVARSLILVGKGVSVQEFLKTYRKGVWIVQVREHVFCVKNGTIYDSINSFEDNHAVLYAYQIKKER